MKDQKPTTTTEGKSTCMNLLLFLALNIFTSVIFGQIEHNQSLGDIRLNEMGTAHLDETMLSRVPDTPKNNGIARFKIDFAFADDVSILHYPNNFLQVYNRWGARVFHEEGYQHDWDGRTTGLATMGAKRKLPIGTYYYILDLGNGTTNDKTGWLYISK